MFVRSGDGGEISTQPLVLPGWGPECPAAGWRCPARPVTGASCSWWGPGSGPGSGPSWHIVMTRGHHEQVTWLRGREGPPPYWWPQRPWPGVEQGPEHFLTM